MWVYNSAKKELVELKDSRITIYNCGPTVYNYVHIGNVRPLVIFDVLTRFLLRCGRDVYSIQNITDVDDKIINAAAQANISEEELATKYTYAYLDLFNLLNIKPMLMPKVSEHIGDIQRYIQGLIDKGAAYIVDGDVYFDVSKAKDYGHISGQNINALLEGVRKENKTNKKSPLDFVLWKKTDTGINWDSPWSKGRPGWHTECCVLINKYAGDHVTIHGGGVDLKFPHHENENAQNVAMTGRDIADVWMHVGHINVNGAKMSKSLNNYILVKDIITKDNAMGLRWFFYKAKYQQPVNFTKELLDASTQEVNAMIKNLNIAKTHLVAHDSFTWMPNAKIDRDFEKELSEDLNLPNAITVIMNQISRLNVLLRSKDYQNANTMYCVIAKELIVLGFPETYGNLHAEHIGTIKSWQKAIDEHDYAKADELRNILISKGLL
ncbi:MAG: cysteine--tRNA ligase [Mycoplasmoidaceae bacterium]